MYTIWCSSVVGYWGYCTVCQGHCWHVVRSFHFTYVINSQTPTVVFKIWLQSLWSVALFLMMGLTPLWCALHVCVHVCASSSNHTLYTLPVAVPSCLACYPSLSDHSCDVYAVWKAGPAAGSVWTVHPYSFSSLTLGIWRQNSVLALSTRKPFYNAWTHFRAPPSCTDCSYCQHYIFNILLSMGYCYWCEIGWWKLIGRGELCGNTSCTIPTHTYSISLTHWLCR